MVRFLRKQPKSLLDLSKDLHDPRVSQVLTQFQERTVSRNRVIALLLLIIWSLAWYFSDPSTPNSAASFNQPQAVEVLPELSMMLVLSAVWWFAMQLGWIKQSGWVDTIGALANFIGVAFILPQSWNLNCVAIIWLPMGCITIGARYTTIPFITSIAASAAITWFAAPAHYWTDKPYFALFTFLLIIGLPLSVHRLLTTMRVVTEAAIRARDAHSRFVATMSHELRTPLNSVLFATEMLGSETDSQKRNALVELLASNAYVLRNRVNAVLDVRSIESGRVALINEAFTFNGLLKTLDNVIASTAQEKAIELTMSAGSAGDIVLRSDPARIEQVLTNLLQNAVKFTPAGGRVDLTIGSLGVDTNGRVIIEAAVADSGIGIPDGAKSHVFEPFYQVSAGTRRTHEGIGLGLHVAKSITQMLQGNISIADNPGGGTIFRWVVPIPRAAQSEKPNKILEFKEAVAAHRQRVKPLRVLVVDDNASNREIAQRMLYMAGHAMISASTGEEGLRQIERGNIDLVLLDMHMPTLDGFGVLQHLKSIKTVMGKHVPPVVVLSADATPQSMDEARKLGAIGYLMKPVAGTRLLTILEDVSGGALPDESLDIIDFQQTSKVAASEETFLDYLRAEGNEAAVEQFIKTCIDGIDGQMANLTISLAAGDVGQSDHFLHCLKNEYQQLGEHEAIRLCTQAREQLQVSGSADVGDLMVLTEKIKEKLNRQGDEGLQVTVAA